jgi:hypothetical protein
VDPGSAVTPPHLGLMLLISLGSVAFWVLIIKGAQGGNDVLIGYALALGAAIAALVVARAVRRARARRRQRERILDAGTMHRARIVGVRTVGANDSSTRVGFELEVVPEAEDAYRAFCTESVPNLAIPRIQPETVIDVWVDPPDRQKVVVDPELLRG